MGRVKVNAHLHPQTTDSTEARPPGLEDLWVCGDIAALTQDGKAVPGVAPAAIQMGRYAAKAITHRVRKRNVALEPYRYVDKGQLATIGKMSAVAALGKFRFAGVTAWLLWAVVHILYLASFRSRILVLFEWAWAWFSWSRPSRIILEKTPRWPPPDPPLAPPPG